MDGERCDLVGVAHPPERDERGVEVVGPGLCWSPCGTDREGRRSRAISTLVNSLFTGGRRLVPKRPRSAGRRSIRWPGRLR
jgi:hypothetical protein